MTFVTGILSKDVPQVWPMVKQYIEGGLGDEGISSEKIYAKLLKTECQLWVAKEGDAIVAACVTTMGRIADKEVCSILSLGGSRMDDWLIYLPQIEAWAASKTQQKIQIEYARLGWMKVLKDRGYRIKSVVLEKDL